MVWHGRCETCDGPTRMGYCGTCELAKRIVDLPDLRTVYKIDDGKPPILRAVEAIKHKKEKPPQKSPGDIRDTIRTVRARQESLSNQGRLLYFSPYVSTEWMSSARFHRKELTREDIADKKEKEFKAAIKCYDGPTRYMHPTRFMRYDERNSFAVTWDDIDMPPMTEKQIDDHVNEIAKSVVRGYDRLSDKSYT